MKGAQFEFRHICKNYESQTALNDVSFRMMCGEHLAIIGSSGCGKSTTLRLLAGLEAPSAGEILMDGNVVSEANRILKPPHLRGIGMVFQDLALWPNLSVIDNVLLGLSGERVPKSEAGKRASQALTLCGIQALAFRKPGTISGGEQQRVALARALAMRPNFLLLDEPFSGLDLVTKTKLLREISRLAADRKLTVILVSHDPVEATVMCRSAIVLAEGRVEESGVLTDLLKAPQSEMLKVFCEY
ncbi:MAG: ABC transporter ATP-binding protein [Acidobacteriota bacterium]